MKHTYEREKWYLVFLTGPVYFTCDLHWYIISCMLVQSLTYNGTLYHICCYSAPVLVYIYQSLGSCRKIHEMFWSDTKYQEQLWKGGDVVETETLWWGSDPANQGEKPKEFELMPRVQPALLEQCSETVPGKINLCVCVCWGSHKD